MEVCVVELLVCFFHLIPRLWNLGKGKGSLIIKGRETSSGG